MADGTILGMPVQVPDDLRTPLGAVVVVKALHADGDVCHMILKTDDITRVEAVGMLIVASDEYRACLAELLRAGDDEP